MRAAGSEIRSEHQGCRQACSCSVLDQSVGTRDVQERSAADMGLMTSTVRILEAFMEFSPNSAGMLRDMGGVETMTGRLRAEVGLPR